MVLIPLFASASFLEIICRGCGRFQLSGEKLIVLEPSTEKSWSPAESREMLIETLDCGLDARRTVKELALPSEIFKEKR